MNYLRQRLVLIIFPVTEWLIAGFFHDLPKVGLLNTSIIKNDSLGWTWKEVVLVCFESSYPPEFSRMK
jgi:hypothetical protein